MLGFFARALLFISYSHCKTLSTLVTNEYAVFHWLFPSDEAKLSSLQGRKLNQKAYPSDRVGRKVLGKV